MRKGGGKQNEKNRIKITKREIKGISRHRGHGGERRGWKDKRKKKIKIKR